MRPAVRNGVRVKAVDLEARVSDEHHQAVKLWLRLLACTNRIEADIRAQQHSDRVIARRPGELRAER